MPSYLQVAEGVACLPIISAALYEDLPAVVRLLPPEDEEGEGARLQLVLVEGQIVDDHGLLVGAGELEGGMDARGQDICAEMSGQKASGRGQKPTAKPFCADLWK